MKAPAFQFYVRDWLLSRSVQKMSGDEVKAYLYLLSEAWLEEPRATLPNDDNDLALMAKLPIESWLRVKPRVMANFNLMDNRWVNLKLAGISETQSKFRNWGKMGGNPNLTHSEPKQVNHIVNPTLKLKVNLASATASATASNKEYSKEFLEVWNAYPNKTGKSKAFDVWKKMNPSEEFKCLILKAIAIQSKWPQWTKDDGKFIPHFSTWMNQMRWEDEGISKVTIQKSKPLSASEALKSIQN